MLESPYVIDNGTGNKLRRVEPVLENHSDLAMDVATAFFNIRRLQSRARNSSRNLGKLRLILGS